MNDFVLFKDECYAIQGAIFEVYRELGCGFLESVYQECLAREFQSRSIPFINQPELRLTYKGQPLQQTFKPDFICFGMILIELKAAKAIAPEHVAQVLNYLKVTGMRLGLLITFGEYPKATIKRLAH